MSPNLNTSRVFFQIRKRLKRVWITGSWEGICSDAGIIEKQRELGESRATFFFGGDYFLAVSYWRLEKIDFSNWTSVCSNRNKRYIRTPRRAINTTNNMISHIRTPPALFSCQMNRMIWIILVNPFAWSQMNWWINWGSH